MDSFIDADSWEERNDVEALLGAAYEKIDNYIEWTSQHCSIKEEELIDDYDNLQSFYEFLADHRYKTLLTMDEFDLRWYLYTYSIRSSGNSDQAISRTPHSLLSYINYLKLSEGYVPPSWLLSILEDSESFYNNLNRYQDMKLLPEEDAEIQYQQWMDELKADLDAHLLLLPADIGEGSQWSSAMGWREAGLWDEALTLWMEYRAALLERGMEFDIMRQELLSTYEGWLSTPQDKLDYETPRSVIIEEQSNAMQDGTEEGSEEDEEEDEYN